MDRTSVVVLIVCFLLLMMWGPLTNKLYPPSPLPETNRVGVGNEPAVDGMENIAPVRPDMAGSTGTVGAAEVEMPQGVKGPDEPEETVVLETGVVRYVFTSHGGGLKRVELLEHDAAVDCNESGEEKEPARLNQPSQVPAFVGFNPALGVGTSFRLQREAGAVVASADMPSGLRLVKRFTVSTNHYLLNVAIRLENPSSSPVTLPVEEWVLGTSTRLGESDVKDLSLGLQWYDGNDATMISQSWFDNRTLGCIPGTPRNQYVAGNGNVVWGAVHNRFFAMAAVPEQPAPRIVGRRVPISASEFGLGQLPSADSSEPSYGYQTGFLYPASVLEPGQSVERKFELFAGPKEYNTLSRFEHQLDLVMDFGFFGFFAKILLLSMNGLHALGLPYGIAIVGITVIIKLIFWPLTTASTRSMKRMALLQPEMKALQEKYKDDPKKMQMKLMQFMKENKVNPLGGCVPILIQLPIFIGFYKMLQSAIELRGATFLWACDLSQPDTVATVAGFPINILPLLMGASMLWQTHMTPPSPGMDPMQQRIMKYMPLIFIVFLYNFSSGLSLYWTVNNLLSILQMKLTRTADPRVTTPPAGGAAATPGPAGPAAGPAKKNKRKR